MKSLPIHEIIRELEINIKNHESAKRANLYENKDKRIRGINILKNEIIRRCKY